jgi:hypothetical protein
MTFVQLLHLCLCGIKNQTKMKKIITILTIFITSTSIAQTDMDGLMMEKNLFCVGATYGSSTWKNYWEGTLKRENLNLGTVTTNNVAINGNYGITNKLNAIFSVPYIKTKASAGQLKGQQGVQDLSLFVKWVGIEQQLKKGILKGILVGGVSLPLTNYTPDLLPLSIGMHSKTASLRAMVDYQKGNWFGTASATYVVRDNVKLDRESYYTTELHYTNEVAMPDATNLNLRAGYRSETWIIEALFNRWITNGGFDITRNNMPFVSNTMNASTIGLHIKYDTKFVNGLSFVGDAMTTLAGRNVGQSSSINVGAFYIMDFSKKKKEETKK